MSTSTSKKAHKPAKDKTKKPTIAWLKWSFIVLFLVVPLAVGVVFFQFQAFLKAPLSSQSSSYVLQVNPGDSARKVANKLYQANFLARPDWFIWYLRYLQKTHIIKAGEIEIQPHWQVAELIQALQHAPVIQYPVTFIAGQTIEENLQNLHALPKIKKQLDLSAVKALKKHFNIAAASPDIERYPYAALEGYFLPETYHYSAGDTDLEILKRAHQALHDVLQQAWQTRQKNLPLQSPYEVLILASIIEKETGYAPERKKIAGVFINRLRRGMRLQTDPTVIYGIGKPFDGNIRKQDLRTKTPYNTYKINRLPPTPIALPSKDAIIAATHPETTKALYFVAKGKGQHHFSKTLKEHNRAVNKYLLAK